MNIKIIISAVCTLILLIFLLGYTSFSAIKDSESILDKTNESIARDAEFYSYKLKTNIADVEKYLIKKGFKQHEYTKEKRPFVAYTPNRMTYPGWYDFGVGNIGTYKLYIKEKWPADHVIWITENGVHEDVYYIISNKNNYF